MFIEPIVCELQSDDELISSNISEKQPKLDFLEKLIKFLERYLEMSVDVKPAKVIAGLDPERTRYLLQLFTVIATAKDMKLVVANQDSPELEPGIEDIASTFAQVDNDDTFPYQDFIANGINDVDGTTLQPKIQEKIVGARPETARGARPETVHGARQGLVKQRKIEVNDDVVGDNEGMPGVMARETMTNNIGKVIQSHQSLKPLPLQLSDIDFQSLAIAVRNISQLTTDMGKHINPAPDTIEKMLKEKSRWISEQHRAEVAMQTRE